MQDRGYIKWAPFNAVVSDKVIFYEVNKRNNECDKPILSDDQLFNLNDKILEAYTNHTKVKISIFRDRNIINVIGYINNINSNLKYITFNKTKLYFNQIIDISNFF